MKISSPFSSNLCFWYFTRYSFYFSVVFCTYIFLFDSFFSSFYLILYLYDLTLCFKLVIIVTVFFLLLLWFVMFFLSQYTNLFTASKCSNRQHWILNKTYTHLTFEGRGICKRYLCRCIRYHSLNARWKFFICWVGAYSQPSRININITSYHIAYCVLLLLKLVGWAHLFIKNRTSISEAV